MTSKSTNKRDVQNETPQTVASSSPNSFITDLDNEASSSPCRNQYQHQYQHFHHPHDSNVSSSSISNVSSAKNDDNNDESNHWKKNAGSARLLGGRMNPRRLDFQEDEDSGDPFQFHQEPEKALVLAPTSLSLPTELVFQNTTTANEEDETEMTMTVTTNHNNNDTSTEEEGQDQYYLDTPSCGMELFLEDYYDDPDELRQSLSCFSVKDVETLTLWEKRSSFHNHTAPTTESTSTTRQLYEIIRQELFHVGGPSSSNSIPLREFNIRNASSHHLRQLFGCDNDGNAMNWAMTNASGFSSLEYLQLHLDKGSLDRALAESLAQLPNLRSLEVESPEPYCIAPLAKSHSLTVLSILSPSQPSSSSSRSSEGSHGDNDSDREQEGSTRLEDCHVQEFCWALLHHHSTCALSVLDLEPTMSMNSLQVLLQTLQQVHDNDWSPSLDTLQFSCTSNDTASSKGDRSPVGGDDIVHELEALLGQKNSSLRVLWNHSYESFWVGERAKAQVLNALEGNKQLEQFHAFVEDPNFWYKKNAILDGNMMNEDHPPSTTTTNNDEDVIN